MWRCGFTQPLADQGKWIKDEVAWNLQGRHDDVPVVMTKPMHEIYFEYNHNDKTFVMPTSTRTTSGEGKSKKR